MDRQSLRLNRARCALSSPVQAERRLGKGLSAGSGQSIARTVKRPFPRELSQWQVTENRNGTTARIPVGDCADPIPDLATRISVLFGNKRVSDLATDTNGN